MKWAKTTLKWGFNWTASRFGEHQRRTDVPKLWILMYHRVLPASDPRYAIEEPGMMVTPETLDQHLTLIRDYFDVVSLADWLSRAKQGEPLPARACAVTFDDGWLDNHEYALPILMKHRTPATLFAVSDKVGTNFRFWPNIVSELVAQNAPALRDHELFKEAATLARQGFNREGIAAVIANLKAYSEAQIFSALEQIDWQNALDNAKPALMSWTQVQDMTSTGLVDIGSHTATHQRLNGDLDPAALRREIKTSQDVIAERLQRKISLFCFPNGDYDHSALASVQETYDAAVTTRRGINRVDQLNRHELQRIALHEDGSNTRHKFLSRLSGW